MEGAFDFGVAVDFLCDGDSDAMGRVGAREIEAESDGLAGFQIEAEGEPEGPGLDAVFLEAHGALEIDHGIGGLKAAGVLGLIANAMNRAVEGVREPQIREPPAFDRFMPQTGVVQAQFRQGEQVPHDGDGEGGQAKRDDNDAPLHGETLRQPGGESNEELIVFAPLAVRAQLKLIFSVIDQFANGRNIIGIHFDQIQFAGTGQFQGGGERENSEVVAVFGDDFDFRGLDM
jgi:hypothetical protein